MSPRKVRAEPHGAAADGLLAAESTAREQVNEQSSGPEVAAADVLPALEARAPRGPGRREDEEPPQPGVEDEDPLRNRVDELLAAAEALRAQGRYEQAERELRRAQRIDPQRADVHARLGVLYLRRGLYGEAAEDLRRALELDPGYGTAYFYRGEALNQLGRVDDALAMLERAVEVEPRHAKAYYTMGILYDRKHMREQAEAMYRKAREVRVTDA